MAPLVDPSQWIKCAKPNPAARLRLFCLPYVGGGASAFRPWAEALPAQVEVCVAQLPGRESRRREPALSRMEPLVEALAEAITPLLALPLVIFGHSMGALIGFELAHLLRQRRGATPLKLFVAGQAAPQRMVAQPPISGLPDDKFLARLRRYNGTPEEVFQHAELLNMLLPVLRADFAAYETYRHTPYTPLDCPIVAFAGSGDAEVACDDIAAWKDQTTGAFKLHVLEGDHFFVHQARSSLLQTIERELFATLGAD